MEDDKPFLFSETNANVKDDVLVGAKKTRKPRSKFWKRYTITMAVITPLLLSPAILAIILATTIDPLYGYFLIPALLPLILAIILLIVSAVVAICFLVTQKPSKKERVILGIFVVLVVILFGFALPILPTL